jgi:hypothetical protein
MFGALGNLSDPSPNPLGSLFGLAGGKLPAAGIGSKLAASPPLPLAPPKQRRVFYSFHYADVFRVNHVRNSGKIRTADKGLRPIDKSLWERVRRTDPANLRRVINAGLDGTSITCVLAGHETWSREWVRYEIAKSLQRGNGLLTVYIDGCNCPRNGYGQRGNNPLDFLAINSDRRIYEFRDGGWYPYNKIPGKLMFWPKWLERPEVGHVTPLSAGTHAYDWIADNGSVNLIRWTCDAARAAGR